MVLPLKESVKLRLKFLSELFLKAILSLLIFALIGSDVNAQEQKNREVCELLKLAKEPVGYLLDKDGNISKGPIDFGRFAVSGHHLIDQVIAPTQYQLLISPARLKLIGTCPAGGCIKLIKIKSICPNSQMFKVGIGFSITKTDETRPYKMTFNDHHIFIGMEFEDPKPPVPFDVKIDFQFDTRVIGELVEPQK